MDTILYRAVERSGQVEDYDACQMLKRYTKDKICNVRSAQLKHKKIDIWCVPTVYGTK